MRIDWTMGRRSASDGVSVKLPLILAAMLSCHHRLEDPMSRSGTEMELAGAIMCLGAGGAVCALLVAVVFAVL